MNTGLGLKAAAKDGVLKDRLIADHTKTSNYDLWKAFNHFFNNEDSECHPALVHTVRTHAHAHKHKHTRASSQRLEGKYTSLITIVSGHDVP